MKRILLIAIVLGVGALIGVQFLVEKKETKYAYDEIYVSNPKTDKPAELMKLYKSITQKEGMPIYKAGYKLRELNSALNSKSKFKSISATSFKERGPSNVPGRTRALYVDPADASLQTWLAGTVGGGVWKSIDGGDSWMNTTPDFPNLSTSTISYSKSNPDVLYLGTGEGWLGSAGFIAGTGMFKSSDRGDSWDLLESTNVEDFEIINSIAVDPSNPDVLYTCTNNDPIFGSHFFSFIFKSVDGGANWEKLYSGNNYIQQVIIDPKNTDVVFATIRGKGVIKSVDAGESWSETNGMLPSGRVEIAISPVNSNRMFASVEGSQTFVNEDGSSGSDIYYSDDAGQSWVVLIEEDESDMIDYFNGQGWYDNAILAHPFDEDIAYVGGVGIWKIALSDGLIEEDPNFYGVVANGTDEFLSLTNFGATYNGGTIDVGNASEFTSVEIRFGADLKQLAHRFTVPEGKGAGVGASEYTYQDYVEVPFEVWDIDSDPPRQLMVSFRDQQDDGVFNLLESYTEGGENDTENNHSREYLYIHNLDYSAEPNSEVTSTTGGHEEENLYFLWPYLTEDAVWDAENLPNSTFSILWRSVEKREYNIESVADVYHDLDGDNVFEQNTGETQVTGVHPDIHNLQALVHNEDNQTWQILCGNDGGVYYSNIATDPGVNDGDWFFGGAGMNTTQFYAADKKPGEDIYIGGSQDNGTWLSVSDSDGSSNSLFQRALGGDGFGSVWHKEDPNKLLGSLYNLAIYKSNDGGTSWSASSGTITDSAPFITKLENSASKPDMVLTVGESGVWVSNNFGSSWKLSPISAFWNASGSFMHVEISDATPDIIWAGTSLSASGKLYLSEDQGASFSAVEFFDGEDFGSLSGIATDPSDYKIAYLLFSYAKTGKIWRTTDMGESWEDITMFEDSVSQNGFPDVATLELLVMPHDPNIIWAGTEIGIFESVDKGESWHILDASFPRVSIWDMNVVEDQVVIATHGRGIWTYDLPVTPVVNKVPELAGVLIGKESDFVAKVDISGAFDSLYVFVDGEAVGVLEDVSEGENELFVEYDFDVSSRVNDESYVFKVVAYANGAPFSSDDLEVEKVAFIAAQDSYVSYFESTLSDFVGSGFSVKKQTGFDNRAIHSTHSYLAGIDDTYTLSIPIKVAASNATIRYSDIALVEPGDAGSNFGDDAFNDYVVVEASLDGLNWEPIIEGYDASYNADWLSEYNATGSKGDPSLFVNHEINLLDFYSVGDEVLIRFRLYANENTATGWGWAIDNLYIQVEPLATENYMGLNIYPNPTLDFVNIESDKSIRKIEVFNQEGKIVRTIDSKTKVDLEDFSKGLYIFKIQFEDETFASARVLKD